jgi:hypothetical protein
LRLSGIDLSHELQLLSVRAGNAAPCCSSCLRRPLPGELMHYYEAGATLCTLCAADLPEDSRVPLRSERIHATEGRLAVVPRAA